MANHFDIDEIEERRVKAAIDALSAEERQAILQQAYGAASPSAGPEGGWSIIDYAGVSPGYATQREAEDAIIEMYLPLP